MRADNPWRWPARLGRATTFIWRRNLDNYTNEGTSHYPYFPEYLSTTFGATTSLRSRQLEVYFDPDRRPGADLNRLATIWHRAGISTVHVKAWYFTRQYSFPYDEFVHACHRNGIAVYAWFVFPMVTPKMWDEHPEWREKTATGADGNVGWRFSMNFQDPDCFQAAMDWTKVLLNSTDWDGMDIAELNFDADFKDYLRPDKFVPDERHRARGLQEEGRFRPQRFVPSQLAALSTRRIRLEWPSSSVPRRHRGGLAPPRADGTRAVVQAARNGSYRDHARQPA